MPSCRATRQERLRLLAGDDLIPKPIACFTHAIDVAAPAERVWPWLVQMGAGRGGWYSYDRLDNGGIPSADRILPDLQHIARGDVMPAVPGARNAFVVARLEPPWDLVLQWPATDGVRSRATWEYLVEPRGAGRSRLIARGRLSELAMAGGSDPERAPRRSPYAVERIHAAILRLPPSLLVLVAGVAHGVMQARALRGIQERSERG